MREVVLHYNGNIRQKKDIQKKSPLSCDVPCTPPPGYGVMFSWFDKDNHADISDAGGDERTSKRFV